MDFSQELLNKLDTIVKHWIPDSTGLGLAIVRRLVQLLQGEI